MENLLAFFVFRDDLGVIRIPEKIWKNMRKIEIHELRGRKGQNAEANG